MQLKLYLIIWYCHPENDISTRHEHVCLLKNRHNEKKIQLFLNPGKYNSTTNKKYTIIFLNCYNCKKKRLLPLETLQINIFSRIK